MAVLQLDNREFKISREDAEYIVEGLELSAMWDKTSIYYTLKDWIDQKDNSSHNL